MWQNRNIAIMAAFRNYFHLTFMNAALLRDSKNVLEKSGPNTRHAEMLRFLNNEQASTMKPIITAYLHESVGYARAGIKPQVEARVVTLQPELVDALGQDQEFSLKFHSLTPGRQNSYVFHLGTTNNPATRIARIVKFRDKVFAGKGANER